MSNKYWEKPGLMFKNDVPHTLTRQLTHSSYGSSIGDMKRLFAMILCLLFVVQAHAVNELTERDIVRGDTTINDSCGFRIGENLVAN